METAALLLAIDREGQALAAAARSGIDREVPSCEGWTVHDVVGHVARVYTSVAEVIDQRLQEQPPRHIPKAPEGSEVVAFFEQAHSEVLRALSGIAADDPIWTWSGDNRGAFYHRRMAHETAIHRWDAESAHGRAGNIDGDLARDGVDEYLDIVLPFSLPNRASELPTETMHLHRTDGDGEWMLTADGASLVVERRHAKGDVAVRGSASDLILFLWNRIPASTLEVFGATSVADAWARLAP